MMTRIIFITLLLLTFLPAHAAERMLLEFELMQGKNKVATGKDYTSEKPRTWSRGSQRSYLKLRCQHNTSGKLEKLYSTVDHFSGLRVTHKLTANNIEITVLRKVVQPRLTEIRALAKNDCKDMSPVVTTTTESYIFPMINNTDETRTFGENMTFRATLKSIMSNN